MIAWMFIFFILFLISLLAGKRALWVPWFLISIIGGLRYKVGTDYSSYVDIYNDVTTNGFYPIEIGYIWLIKIVNAIGGSYQLVFLLTFSMSMLLLYQGSKYLMKEMNLSHFFPFIFLVYCFILMFFIFTSVRQGLALSIIFYATRYLLDKRFFYYSIFIVVAAFFHVSSLIFMPLYFFLNKRISNRLLILFSLLLITIIFYSPLPLIGAILSKFGSSYARFFEMSFYAFQGANTSKLVLTLLTISLIAYSLFYIDRTLKVNNVLFNIMLVFILFRILALDMDVVSRLSNYFKPYVGIYLLLIISTVVKKLRIIGEHRNSSYILIGYFIFLMLFFINIIYIGNLGMMNKSFNHLTFNLGLFGERDIVNIYGGFRFNEIFND